MKGRAHISFNETPSSSHERLGHISSIVIKETAGCGKGISTDEQKLKTKVCHPCLIGKSTRAPRKISVANKQNRKPIERVFTDVVGPIQIPSLNRSKYFVTF